MELYSLLKLVQSDKGTETLLMAIAHYTLRVDLKPEIGPRKAFAYSTSTKNQRIEKWWKTLLLGETEQWREYFEALNDTNLFDGSKYN